MFPRLDHGLPTLHAAPSPVQPPSGRSALFPRLLPLLSCLQRGPCPSVEGSNLSAGPGSGRKFQAEPPAEHSGPASGPRRTMLTGAVDRVLLWIGVSTLISVCVTSPARLGPCLCQPVICQESETWRLYNGKVVVRLHYTPVPRSPDKGCNQNLICKDTSPVLWRLCCCIFLGSLG